MLQIPTSLKSAPEALNSPAAIKAYDDFAAAAARDSFWTYRKHMPAWDWFPRRLAHAQKQILLSSLWMSRRRRWSGIRTRSSAALPIGVNTRELRETCEFDSIHFNHGSGSWFTSVTPGKGLRRVASLVKRKHVGCVGILKVVSDREAFCPVTPVPV
jgi:hypothetical protein